MNGDQLERSRGGQDRLSRRGFLYQSATAASAPLLGATLGLGAEEQPQAAAPAERTRKIKIGQVGLGGRGSWIASLFQQHGGYQFHAVADYFPEVADVRGESLDSFARQPTENARRLFGLR